MDILESGRQSYPEEQSRIHFADWFWHCFGPNRWHFANHLFAKPGNVYFVFFLILELTLIISSLMAKTWRIHRIFNNPNAAALHISDKRLLLFPAVLMSLFMLFCIIYCFASGPLILKREQGQSNPFYVFDLFSSRSDWFQIFSVIFFYVYFFILFAITATMAFLTRQAHAPYRESKSITMIIYIYLSMGIIYIPLYYLQSDSMDSQDTRLAIACLNIGLLMLATLLIIYLPPILNLRRKQRRSKTSSE